MDLTRIEARIREASGSAMSVEMEFLVDPDITVSIIPGKVLDDLGIPADGEQAVELGEGRQATRKVGRAWFEVLGRGAEARAAWGAPGEKPRMGQEVISACGLMVDPVTRILRLPRRTGE